MAAIRRRAGLRLGVDTASSATSAANVTPSRAKASQTTAGASEALAGFARPGNRLAGSIRAMGPASRQSKTAPSNWNPTPTCGSSWRDLRVRRRTPGYTHIVRTHDWIDRRSLALHEAVAAKLEAQPELLEVARANLRRWLSTHPAAPLFEWSHLLQTTPLPKLLVLLRSTSDESARLRQSSPFAGLLTPRERQAILSDHEPRRA